VVRLVPPSRSWLPAFASAAGSYWLSVFPAVGDEVRRWETRARTIPDPVLRGLALRALRDERGNLEGAAAFAAFVPCPHRQRVVRAAVAFQAAYDYADALSEQPNTRAIDNARRLHAALAAALGASREAPDHYRHNSRSDDGGYLRALTERCWGAVRVLPSYSAIAAPAQEAAERMAIYQSLNLAEAQGGREALERWALAGGPARNGLHWWEAAAATGSSLVVFALIAAAASPDLSGRDVEALTYAYVPWIGALHILLDSLIDRAEDAESGYRSFIDYYSSPQHAACRLQAIAARSARLARALPCSAQHSLMLAAMVSFYLAATDSRSPHSRLARPAVLTAMGEPAIPTMLVMSARRRAARLRR
jgi:tetraprenyl-beta-curcumene synthase